MNSKPGHEWDEHEWVLSHSEWVSMTMGECTIELPFDVMYCECGARYSRTREIDDAPERPT